MADPENKTVVEVENAEDHAEDVEDESGSSPVNEVLGSIPGQVMKNPQALAALQDRLGSLIGSPSGYIQSLPKVVKRRIKALKKLQSEAIKIEGSFYEEVHKLECKYATKYNGLYEKRRDVVCGNVEPTDEESDWPSDDEKDEEDQLSGDLKNKAKLEDSKEKKEEKEEEEKEEENPNGIPQFWLTILKNVDTLSEMIQDHDEPILQHLNDIKVKFSEANPMGFTLEFHFEANDFFTNTVLTKEYTMRSEPDETDPLSYEGPEIIKNKGCSIDWKKGKDVTVKLIKKKQKHKGRGTFRTVTKTVQNDSFFNFFNPPNVPDGEESEVDEDTEALLAADFEIGHFIRERIVPRAVLYFTGEALDDDDYDEEGEEEEEGEEGEEDEENDADYDPNSKKEKPQECKQQ